MSRDGVICGGASTKLSSKLQVGTYLTLPTQPYLILLPKLIDDDDVDDEMQTLAGRSTEVAAPIFFSS
jgi:hypothetical protein